MGAQKLVLVLCAVLALLLGETRAQSCQVYNSSISDGELSFCAGVFADDYEYYLPFNKTQEQMELSAVAGVTKGDATLEKLLLLLPGSCTAELKRAACLAAFPPCQYVELFLADVTFGTVNLVNEQACTTADCLSGLSDADAEAACEGEGFRFSNNRCFGGLPKYPCRAETCRDPIVSSDPSTSKCPIVTGLFNGALFQGLASPDLDPVTKSEFQNKLGACIGGDPLDFTSECSKTLYNVNLLQVFGFAPDCASTINVGFDVDTFPEESAGQNAGYSGYLTAKTSTLSNDCGINIDGSVAVCSAIITDLTGANSCPKPADVTLDFEVQRSFDVIEDSSICADFIKSDVNNGVNGGDFKFSEPRHVIASLDTLRQAPANQGECLASHKEEVYKGLYFVADQPGMPKLSAAYDPGQKQKENADNWDTDACPNVDETGRTFANFQDTPLCEREGKAYYNNRDCTVDTVTAFQEVFPAFAPYRCSTAALELVCSRLHMKLQANVLCLSPDGCASSVLEAAVDPTALNQGFYFFAPRFPSKTMCDKVNDECASIIAASPDLQALFDCDQVIDIQDCSVAGNGFFGCSNSLNGLPAYPDGIQVLADAAGIGAFADYIQYSVNVSRPLNPVVVGAALTSSTVEPTLSAVLFDNDASEEELKDLQEEFCVCEFPLVVPDDPNAPTITESVCCALPCRGTMHTEEDMERFGITQTVLSGLGVIFSLYMAITWAFFKEKHKQYMTFWIAICAFNVSLAFFLMAATAESYPSTESNLCVDNSQPHSQKTTGFSLCVFQSAWLIFWAQSECGWWFCQSLDLFRKLVLGRRSTDESKLKYHLFAWTFPAIAVSVLIVIQALGYKQPSPYCLIAEDQPLIVEWIAFYLWIALLFIGGTVMMFSVLAVIIRHTNRAGNLAASSEGKFRSRYRMYRTPMLFVLLFIFVWLNIFAFRLQTTIKEQDYIDDAQEWIFCLLGNTGIEGGAAAICGETQPDGVSKGSLNLTLVVVFAQAILIFIVFGIQGDSITLWLEYFGCKDASDRTRYTDGASSKSKDNSKIGNSSYFQSKEGSSYGGNTGSYFNGVSAPRGPAPVPPSPGGYGGSYGGNSFNSSYGQQSYGQSFNGY